MNIKALIPAIVIASTLAAPAFAQTNSAVPQGGPVSQAGQWVPPTGQPSTPKTRAQVYHELIHAQQDGQIDYLNSTVYRGS